MCKDSVNRGTKINVDISLHSVNKHLNLDKRGLDFFDLPSLLVDVYSVIKTQDVPINLTPVPQLQRHRHKIRRID